jgi:hypothetical protein
MVEIILVLAILAVLVGIYLGMKVRKERQRLIDSGQIIDRKYGFEEYAEIFTIKEVPFSEVWSTIRSANYYRKANVKAVQGKEAIAFAGADWGAYLYHMSGEADRNAYRFDFTKWSTTNGVPNELLAMNTVLTSVEKAFLQLDPNTQVSTKKIKIKNKHSFF